MEDEKKLLSTEETEKHIDSVKEPDKLRSLIYDDNEDFDTESEEETVDFDAFMEEYRSILAAGKAKKEEEPPIVEEKPLTEEEERKEYEEEYLAPLPRKQSQKKKSKKAVEREDSAEKKSDWDEGITLTPQEYESLDGDDGEPTEEPEEEFIPDFDLGESKGDDDFQLSISFDSEGKHSHTPVPDEDESKDQKYDPEKPRAIDWVFDIAEMFVFVLAIVMLLTSFVFKHSVVEGNSMNNTLRDGDHLIISDLFYTPERGDIVVFEDYSTILKKAVVKRVIGLPGETVDVDVDSDGNVLVYINGKLLPEEYSFNAKDANIHDCPAVTLGENEIFVMGDNRYHSTDSRHEGVGPIDIDTVLGKVLFRFFPFDSFGAVD